MATGRRAFDGETQSALESAILEQQPPPIATLLDDPKSAPFYSALDRVLADCLVKNPDQRRQRMQNVLVDLKLMSAAARAAAAKVRPVAPAPAPRSAPKPGANEVRPPRETLAKQV